MARYIVIVEDDFLQEGPLQDHLQSAFTGARVETLCTESEFRDRLPGLRQDVPDIVIMDVMLRWAYPGPQSPPPTADVIEGAYFRAGLRCAALMADTLELRGVPVILYTILERSDLDRDGERLGDAIEYVRKSADLEILTRKVRSLIRATAT